MPSPRRVSQILKGKKPPKPKTVNAMAKRAAKRKQLWQGKKDGEQPKVLQLEQQKEQLNVDKKKAPQGAFLF